LLKDVAESLKERGLDEVVTFVEFLTPKVTQKE